MEPAEQADQAADVVGMVAALDEALPRDARRSGSGLLQLLARDAVAERHRQRAEKPLVVVLAVVCGVVEQVDLRVLLALGVQALAGHVGAHRRQDVRLSAATDSCRPVMQTSTATMVQRLRPLATGCLTLMSSNNVCLGR